MQFAAVQDLCSRKKLSKGRKKKGNRLEIFLWFKKKAWTQNESEQTSEKTKPFPFTVNKAQYKDCTLLTLCFLRSGLLCNAVPSTHCRNEQWCIVSVSFCWMVFSHLIMTNLFIQLLWRNVPFHMLFTGIENKWLPKWDILYISAWLNELDMRKWCFLLFSSLNQEKMQEWQKVS